MNKISPDLSEAVPASRHPLAPLRPVANKCSTGQCPTVYVSADSGTVVVQGYAVTAERAGVDVPDGEVLVEIPFDLLADAVRNLS